tara:strand:+ start:3271 stop:3504 length:234 start_codon:yes stop_codon:yes gene_type:complete
MDHFCPWAGGIIGETTHKYFMQLVGYTALYTTFVWIVVAVFLADRISKVSTMIAVPSYKSEPKKLTAYRLGRVLDLG